MISAAEARQKSKHNREAALTTALKDIEREIDKSILQGKTFCTVFVYISAELIQQLELLGYSVTKGPNMNDQRGELTYKIGWE